MLSQHAQHLASQLAEAAACGFHAHIHGVPDTIHPRVPSIHAVCSALGRTIGAIDAYLGDVSRRVRHVDEFLHAFGAADVRLGTFGGDAVKLAQHAAHVHNVAACGDMAGAWLTRCAANGRLAASAIWSGLAAQGRRAEFLSQVCAILKSTSMPGNCGGTVALRPESLLVGMWASMLRCALSLMSGARVLLKLNVHATLTAHRQSNASGVISVVTVCTAMQAMLMLLHGNRKTRAILAASNIQPDHHE